MKKFVFPLETLLRVRRQHEDVAKRDFALALGRQSRAEEAVREIDRRTAEARAELAALQKGSVDVGKIVSYYRFLSGQEVRRRGALEELKKLEKATETERSKLVEARREKRVVEILKEKHYKRYLQEEDKREQKEIDDVVSTRAAARAMRGEA